MGEGPRRKLGWGESLSSLLFPGDQSPRAIHFRAKEGTVRVVAPSLFLRDGNTEAPLHLHLQPVPRPPSEDSGLAHMEP